MFFDLQNKVFDYLVEIKTPQFQQLSFNLCLQIELWDSDIAPFKPNRLLLLFANHAHQTSANLQLMNHQVERLCLCQWFGVSAPGANQ